ncbi:hypothetical protein V498_02792 [Pseudogymnoascus sp. VKM F-4517 (FW-2822)]|nr:hypothetical protein V498_02792 [Pseudogymnoascus sp. VKM F-4517 (FW-2822)]
MSVQSYIMGDEQSPTERSLSPSHTPGSSPDEEARPSTPRKPKSHGRRRAAMACRGFYSESASKLTVSNRYDPIASISCDWPPQSERPGANQLLQFIRNQHLNSQSQIDGQTQFSATRHGGHDGNCHLGSFPAKKPSFPMPEDPELSRWLEMMPPHIVEKFRLHFQNMGESGGGIERGALKPDPTTLSRVQQAMDTLQDLMTIFKSTQPDEELLSPPPDSMFQAGTGETDGNLPLGYQGFTIATSYPLPDTPTTENDSDDWDEELMAELFCTHMVQEPVSGAADLKPYVDSQ